MSRAIRPWRLQLERESVVGKIQLAVFFRPGRPLPDRRKTLRREGSASIRCSQSIFIIRNPLQTSGRQRRTSHIVDCGAFGILVDAAVICRLHGLMSVSLRHITATRFHKFSNPCLFPAAILVAAWREKPSEAKHRCPVFTASAGSCNTRRTR